MNAAEAAALDARLSEPRLAAADVDGFPLRYVLSYLTEAGRSDVTGTFGRVSG